MKELQKWLDMEPTLRRCILEWSVEHGWDVTVSDPSGGGGGNSESLTFAVVAAILDFRKNKED